MITSEQIRAARAVLRWSLHELSKHCEVSVSTLKRLDKESGVPLHINVENLQKIKEAIEKTGKVKIVDPNKIIIIT